MYHVVIKITISVHKPNTSNQRTTFQDKKHLYLYYHPPQIKNNFGTANDVIDGKGKKSVNWYECIPLASMAIKMHWNQMQLGRDNPETHSFALILGLLQEVVKNGYISDLLPKTKVNQMYGDEKHISNILQLMMNEYQILEMNDRCIDQLKNRFHKFCTNTFRIFEQVKQKMNHSRFKKMGSPLAEREMLVLILYCNGDCNYNLSETQRDGSFKHKWAIFDSLLNHAIGILSNFEEHWENIYTGVCNVFYKFTNKYEMRDIVYLTTNVSFTTDLKVAKQFRGSSGMIIGLNMKRSYAATVDGFRACDVSWISDHLREKEILCQRGSEIRFYRNKMTETCIGNEKQQWFVCDEGNLQETSFPAMFPST